VEDESLLDTSNLERLFSFKPTEMVQQQMRELKMKEEQETIKQNYMIPPLPMDKI
jgi:hypothetical protein